MVNKTLVAVSLIALFLLSVTLVSAESDEIDLDEYTVLYEYEDSDVEAGERFSLDVTITNEDNDNRTDVVFELDDTSVFEISGDDSMEVDVLMPGESISKTFRINVDDDADDKDYELEFTLEDDDDDYDDVIEIDVNSDLPNLFIGDISSSPATIMPDSDDVRLTFVIENSGNTDASFVLVKLVLPEGIEPSSSFADSANLGVIEAGENKEVDFYVDVLENVPSGNLEAKLDLTYETEGDDEERESLNFNIPVKGKPQFQVTSAIVSPTVPAQGEEATISITVTNVGGEEGRETSVRVFENSDLPFEFNEKTRYIGTLENGESGTAVFTFEVDSDAYPNNYLMKVQIRTVSEDNVFVEEQTIAIKTKKSEGQFSVSPLWTIVIVVAVIMFLLSYIVFRKR